LNEYYGLLNDKQIRELCDFDGGMIAPFETTQKGKPSYGLGSSGYDLRLGTKFLVPIESPHSLLDPLNRRDDLFRAVEKKEFFDLPPNSFVLAESVEWFVMPEDVCGVCYGKSSYARCGLLANVTPLENEWAGRLTMELSNLGKAPIRLHVGQGIAQIVFFRQQRPARTYIEKEAGGIYQNQAGVTPAL
jgi:dCTP deaminase